MATSSANWSRDFEYKDSDIERRHAGVPIGEPGEIYIGGVSLAKGYINREDLTEERFIEDPWDDCQGAQLYRTGDYGKYLSDGNISFIGRKDHQIKIRGFRVELQEIDSNLIQFPGIQEAVVIVKNAINKEKYLEAFLVVNIEHEDDLFDRIIKFLKDKLPLHMVPSCFHVIEKMPLTPSGKINRRALENYGMESIKHSRHFTYLTHPTTTTEKMLIKILEDFSRSM